MLTLEGLTLPCNIWKIWVIREYTSGSSREFSNGVLEEISPTCWSRGKNGIAQIRGHQLGWFQFQVFTYSDGHTNEIMLRGYVGTLHYTYIMFVVIGVYDIFTDSL